MNKCQTEYPVEYIDSLPREVKEQYYDFITNVPYIKALLSNERLYAKDLSKDNDGKIIIDITKPHILEDTNYFRPQLYTIKSMDALLNLNLMLILIVNMVNGLEKKSEGVGKVI